ncbi:Uncharacterised protein [Serratia marcescens]|uniref:helix-turn-helix domain-containing protein n=1 Tax=Serratia marcescens TaxID=615 RepID=UPI00074558FA|nr:helix-turn-helix domain-containing protein [Serratia marcescens]CVF89524.1 Uncharacterised protein [Serratia marcescens]
MTTAVQAVNNIAPFVKSYTCIKSVLKFTAKTGETVEFKYYSKDVYLYLLSYAENTGIKEIYPSYPTIAKDTGHSVESVKRAIKFLSDNDFIVKGKKTTDAYQVNLYTVASLQEAMKIIGNSEKVGKQNASRPTAKRKPAPATMENQEQSNNVVSLDTGKPVQSCDSLPVITDVIDSVQPKEEKAANDSVLPVNGSDNDRSDEVIIVDVKDDLDLYTQIADNFGVKYNLPEIMHMCRGDRVKAAKRLKGEIDTFHNLAKQNAQQPAQLVIDGDFDYDLDEETADGAGYAF